MTLLATSTPEHRNHVRVLFYGQSITEQEWSKQVAAGPARHAFPMPTWRSRTAPSAGSPSQLLIRPAEHDVYPFYPDLVIFHVFGANQQYEQIIQEHSQPHYCRGVDATRPRRRQVAAGRSQTRRRTRGSGGTT